MSGAPGAAPRVWWDGDPGHDDAFALFFAAVHTDLVGLSTVSGNVDLDATTHNARVVRDLARLEAPLHRGAAGPLVGEPLHAPDIHGASGLAGPAPRTPRSPVEATPAAEAIVAAAKREEAHGGLWLVATGPLTNVALALRLDPDLPRRLKGISIMGGSRSFGNTTPAAEFNILADPEAAAATFESGAHVVMAGLDLTHRFRLGATHAAALRAAGGEVATFAAELLEAFLAAYERRSGLASAPMHDPLAVMLVTHPEVFDTEALHVRVETAGRHTRGMTLCDEREIAHRLPATATVGVDLDADRAWTYLRDAVATLSNGG